MPELFPRMYVADVHLKERDSDTAQGISKCYAGVCEASRIDDDVLADAACFVDAVDDGSFVVRLEVLYLDAELAALGLRAFDDVRECCAAVDVWLACSQEVQVRTIDEEDCFRHCCEFLRICVATGRTWSL